MSRLRADELAALPFAASFPTSVLERLVALSSRRTATAGEVLFREGGVNHQLYLVIRGQVSLEMCVPASGCTRLLTLGPGDVLAWSALLGGDRMTATAICQEDVELAALDGPPLLELCESDHDLGYRVMKQLAVALSKRLLATRLQLLDLFQTSGDGA